MEFAGQYGHDIKLAIEKSDRPRTEFWNSGNVQVFCPFTDSLSLLERYSCPLSFIAQLTNAQFF